MDVAAFILAAVALAVSAWTSLRQLRLARHANTLPVLVDLFREHRGERLARARVIVYKELSQLDVTNGLSGLPPEAQGLVRDLGWYYDNLGALVAHSIVDIRPVSGYLGNSVISAWEAIEPLAKEERATRARQTKRQDMLHEPDRFLIYFENLYHLVLEEPSARARISGRLWRIPSRDRLAQPLSSDRPN